MKRSNIIGIIAAAVVIIVSVVLISWYLRKTTPMLIQGTVECTTYKASSKVPGRIDDMKVSQGDRVEKGQLLYTLSTPELEGVVEVLHAVVGLARQFQPGLRLLPHVQGGFDLLDAGACQGCLVECRGGALHGLGLLEFGLQLGGQSVSSSCPFSTRSP